MKKILIFVVILAIGFGIGWLVNNYYNRPCMIAERQIRQNYSFSKEMAESDDIIQRIQLARMYAELATNGCPEKQDEYTSRYNAEVASINAQGHLFIVNTGMEIKADMQKVADAVNEVTREAADAIGNFVDRMKNTKIKITVE